MAMDRRAVMQEEMMKGRESATELKASLQPIASPEQAALIERILGSFSKLITLSCDKSDAEDQFMLEGSGEQGSLIAVVGSPGSETSSEKKRPISSRDRRVSHRRRRHLRSWTSVTNDEKLDDGHCWRKYGQKEIQSKKYPRSYFRCIHRRTQGCPAMKQVQKADDDDSTFIITYIGEHTCRELPKVDTHFIENSLLSIHETNLISFASKPNGKDKETRSHAAFSCSPLFPQIKTSNNFMQFQDEDSLVQDLTPTCSSSECFTIGSGSNDIITGFDGSLQVSEIINYVDHAAAAAVGTSSDKNTWFGNGSGAFDMDNFLAASMLYDGVFDFDKDYVEYSSSN